MPMLRNPRIPWTMEEEEALKQGMEIHGGVHNRWIAIKKAYPYYFSHRTGVNLKDKWRTIGPKGINSENLK